jgi:hypothetical protein
MGHIGQTRMYNRADKKRNTRSPVHFERNLYPAHARTQLKDKQEKVKDTEDQYY